MILELKKKSNAWLNSKIKRKAHLEAISKHILKNDGGFFYSKNRLRLLQMMERIFSRILKLGFLRGIPDMPAGLPRIEVEFLIDANGLLNVSAKELRSGIETQIEVVPDQGLRQQEIDEMIESSIVNAESDFRQSRLQEFRFQAESILKALEKSWELAQGFFANSKNTAISLDTVILQKEKLSEVLKQNRSFAD